MTLRRRNASGDGGRHRDRCGRGALHCVDPGQTIALEAQGQISIDGALTAPSGTISVVNDQYKGTSNSLSIFLGADSALNVSAQTAAAADAEGRMFGVVPNGGTIRIGGQTQSNGSLSWTPTKPDDQCLHPRPARRDAGRRGRQSA